MKITVTVIPKSSQTKITIQPDGSFKAKLTCAPVDGKANEQLIKLLAKYFSTNISKIKIIKGFNNKHKLIEIIL